MQLTWLRRWDDKSANDINYDSYQPKASQGVVLIDGAVAIEWLPLERAWALREKS